MDKLVLISLIVVLGHFKTYACTCGKSSTREQAFKQSQVVISVRVLKVLSSVDPIEKEITKTGDTLSFVSAFGYSKLLLVTKTYKGTISNDTIVIEGDNSNCELYLQVGHSYIIFAYYIDGKIYSDRCTRSGLVANHPDLSFLERKLKRRK